MKKLNQKAMKLFKMGEKEQALAILTKAEQRVESMKEYWYYHQKHLGDLLSNPEACSAITITFNNLGVYHKS